MQCGHHRCGGFQATHVLQTKTRRYYVRAEDGGDKVNLFTGPEWDTQRDASWSMCEGIISHNGSSKGIAKGATIQNFGDCEETIADGWEDGCPGRDARFVED